MRTRYFVSAMAMLIASCGSQLTLTAQTLNVVSGNVTTQYTAAQAGEMTFGDNGVSLTINGKTYTTDDISINIDESKVTDNTVTVTYDGTSARVVVAGNVASYVTAEISGAHVSITQTNTDDIDGDEITYILSGTSSDGAFDMSGSYKATVELNGLTLTNPSGAAISIDNGKRIDLKVQGGTENTLTDCSNGSQKACLYIKGHAEFKGKGTLNVTGNTKHAIKTGEYMTMKNCTINIAKAAKDGINVQEYFLMESGVITIANVIDEGIQCDLDGDTSTGETSGHDDEDSGNIYITGGTISITAPQSEGIESKGEMTISGGTINVTAKDDAINSASHMTISGGYVMANSTGNDGLDANGNLYIKGGVVYAIAARSPEVAIDANTEGGYKLYVQGGTIIAIGGLESGSSLNQSCYQTSSYSKNTWYALTGGSETVAFKIPSNSSMGTPLVVSTASTPSLTSGVTVSGTSIWDGYGYSSASVSGGSTVSLSSYTGSNQGGPGGGGRGPGGH